jgi:hypothetical protein
MMVAIIIYYIVFIIIYLFIISSNFYNISFSKLIALIIRKESYVCTKIEVQKLSHIKLAVFI